MFRINYSKKKVTLNLFLIIFYSSTDAKIRVKWETVSHVGKLWDNSYGEYQTTFPVSIPNKN